MEIPTYYDFLVIVKAAVLSRIAVRMQNVYGTKQQIIFIINYTRTVKQYRAMHTETGYFFKYFAFRKEKA
ncbi:hypothetical protein BG910_05000 [Neisseria chenwenguii]|uniref:Uncharacterized protein n=1 Tax=Neisseria chenwenguii TaxID=1853278 RepID=A0A220S141_9NEIS|nr:hypothetical protein BG910_05000 [Neisseria chenwenguii]ROV54886.1 hypothetical protein EGS38_10390 [Neisseria chenwenguii]